MNVLLSVLLVAVAPEVPIEARYPEADAVFHCDFDDSCDENFDKWPDRWERPQGPRYPRYVSVKISEDSSPMDSRCLRVDLDGGAAAAYSPPVKIAPLFSYVLEGYVKTDGLEHDRAYFSITLLNRRRQRLQTLYSEKVCQTQGWKKLRLGPIAPESEGARFALVGVHVEPGSQQDLKGVVLFGDVWLGQLPRMRLKTSDPHGFFTDPKDVKILCSVSGFLDENSEVTFRIEDIDGEAVARAQRRLSSEPAIADVDFSLESYSGGPTGVIVSAKWKPPISEPGFYRVGATMRGRKELLLWQELSLVVVEPQHSAAGGAFGWTLPQGDDPLSLSALERLVGQAGINWVKYPLWPDERRGNAYIDHLCAFGQRLEGRGIELVGLLCKPQRAMRNDQESAAPLPAARTFAADPKVWYPSLEPVVNRLGGQVRWWQLGDDDDTSFVDDPNSAEKVAQVKTRLDELGPEAGLAIGWDWLHELPQLAGSAVPWRSLVLSADPSMTHEELSTYLTASEGIPLERWVVLEPLSADLYPMKERVTDLVRRMMAAKIHGAEAVFCPQPFRTGHGLMNDDGTPGELFLPWRTTALLLGGAEYLGSVELPGGSTNQLFCRAHDVVMVVWNDEPTEEVIYLGEDVEQIDLWGRRTTPSEQGDRQVIRVGRLPTFVTGVNEAITRWRMGFSFARERIPSIFGVRQQDSLRQQNHFAQQATGRAELVMPETWMVTPRQVDFDLAAGEAMEHAFEITLPLDALSGVQKVCVDYEVQTDRLYRFSVYRQMEVGLGDVHIETATALNDQGDLEVQQRLANDSDQRVSFRCQLYAPGRRRLMTQVVDLGRTVDVQTYRMPDGKQLLGETLWLRAEEIDGRRTLSYRFPVKP
ncbi:MAG: hypothetical protein A2V70_06735 [Planctomycetes bacterium RBG_13_63_9]|nr:MAG: hypothetical protein A2V70_06735 [Planctomycetes bacterium RBG_13_63_9]